MKVIDAEMLNFRGLKKPICCAILDCTYLQLIREDGKIRRPNVSNKKVKGNKKNPKRIENLCLIIGVTKPTGEFSEVRASINMVSPLDAKGSLSIYPPDVNLVPPNSEIELLRYDIFPVI